MDLNRRDYAPTHPGFDKVHRYAKEWFGLLIRGCFAKKLCLKLSKKNPTLCIYHPLAVRKTDTIHSFTNLWDFEFWFNIDNSCDTAGTKNSGVEWGSSGLRIWTTTPNTDHCSANNYGGYRRPIISRFYSKNWTMVVNEADDECLHTTILLNTLDLAA